MTDAAAQPAPFAYLHVRTSYGPGGGPGTPAGYARAARAAGYSALACADYGSVAAWPEWAQACAQAGLRPLFGCAFDLVLDDAPGAPAWPLLALAATATGLRHLVLLHNRLERLPDGACRLPLATLPDFAAGLWLILLPAGDRGAAPLVALPRRAAVAAAERLTAALPRPEQLLCGLPPAAGEQAIFADLAAAAGLAPVALPTVRYAAPEQAGAHQLVRVLWDPSEPARAALRATVDGLAEAETVPLPGAPAAAVDLHAILSPDEIAAQYHAFPDAVARAGALAASCHVALPDLAAPTPAGETLAAVVAEAAAAAGQSIDAAVGAEQAALARLGLAADLLAARRVAEGARRLGLLCGATGGVAAEGRLAALLGLAPPPPFGAPPSWLDAPDPRPALAPRLTVAATRRAALLAALDAEHAGPVSAARELVPAGGRQAQGPAGAVAALGRALDLPPRVVAALTRALVIGRSGERALRWRSAAPPDWAPATTATLLDWVMAVEALPGPPLADAEAVLVLPAAHWLPLLPAVAAPGEAAGRVAAWPAADCVALGAGLLRVAGDPALDGLQRAVDLAGGPPPPVPADALRLVLTSGALAGLPLPEPPSVEPEESWGPDVLAALAAALIPDDPADLAGWAAIGALLYGPAGPHRRLDRYVRRHVGAEPVSYRSAALASAVRLTYGEVLYREQLATLRLQLAADPDADPRTREGVARAGGELVAYAEALAAGERLHLALALKAARPAPFLAAALEQAVLDGADATARALALEVQQRGLIILPPDVQRGDAGFTLEDGAIRWGLAWTRAAQARLARLVAARARRPDGRFATFADLCEAAAEAGVAAGDLAALIRAGACDSLGARAALLADVPGALAAAARRVAARRPAAPPQQTSLFDLAAPAAAAAELPTDAEAPPAEDAEAVTAPATPEPRTAPRTWELLLTGHAFTAGPAAAAMRDADPNRGDRRVARLTLAGITDAQVGQTVSLAVALHSLRDVPDGGSGGEVLATAVAEDGAGRLPVVLFPPVYTRYKPLLPAEDPVILVARVQRAEAWEGAGAALVLIAEQVLPYQVQRAEAELDLTVRKRRASTAPAERASKPVADPRQYSTNGQPYFTAPRAAEPAAEAPAATPPSASPPSQVVLTLAPLLDDAADDARMLRLREIMKQYPGETAVLLYFPDDPTVGGPAYMPLKRKVAATPEFCAAVGTLLGPGSYELRS